MLIMRETSCFRGEKSPSQLPRVGDRQSETLCYGQSMEHEDPFENLFVIPNEVRVDQVRGEAERLDAWGEALPTEEDAAALRGLIHAAQKMLNPSMYAAHLSAFESLLLIMLIAQMNEVKKTHVALDKLSGKWVHPPFP